MAEKNIKVSVGESESASESVWKDVLENMYAPSLSYDDDDNPYELEEGYDASDPRFPDRRWHYRIFPEHIAAPDPEEDMWQDDSPTYEKLPIFTIEPGEYDQAKYREWLENERRYERQLPQGFENNIIDELDHEDREAEEMAWNEALIAEEEAAAADVAAEAMAIAVAIAAEEMNAQQQPEEPIDAAMAG